MNSRFRGRKRIDRISRLPDDVLVHILSFLPTKHAVGTSILSHRWQYLFTQVTNLDFDESLMFHPRNSMEDLVSTRTHFELLQKNQNHGFPHLKLVCSFKDFVDRVLMLNKSPNISKFRLKCSWGCDCSNLNVWIRFALLHDVIELDILTKEYKSCLLPTSLYTSQTLVALKLHGKFEMKFPASTHLPHLKSLQLFGVDFSGPYSLNGLIAGCPLLEDLTVGGAWEDVIDINISSARLTSLTMNFRESFCSEYHRSSVVLDLPNLHRFKYVDRLASNYSLKNLNLLEEARIEVLLNTDDFSLWSTFCGSVLGLLNGVSNAKHLYVCGKCMEAIQCEKYTLPTFHNLSRLELGWSRCVNWRVLLCDFLQSAPILEHLAFSKGLFHRQSDCDDYEDNNFWSNQETPVCLSSNIKTIMIGSFHGFEEEVKMARYFLKNGKFLEKLILECFIRSDEEERELKKLLKKLLKAEKASKECIIEII
ncbi:unnamed protein product [Cuscuta epithymum]|uniref:F-box domain-containing protein n=1 Tax=Cuscuta epithymum TaxID=186058 RepID=A0AAV0DSZ5_9ASTE|nr:unnamed protein product [Cuscuta epithymum]